MNEFRTKFHRLQDDSGGFSTSEAPSMRMTFFQREQRKQAEWLASVCHAIDTQGVCPANITPSFWCPLGDDGICENVTADDWLVVLKKAEEKK